MILFYKILSCSLLVISIYACTGTGDKQPEDPLQNTKKLIKEGHTSLYENGAINVSNTKIMLIPPGPSAIDFALELSGMKARRSLLSSLANARDAVYLVADGTRKSFKVADGIIESTDEVSNEITKYSRENAKLLVYRAYPSTKHIMGESVKFSNKLAEEIEKIALQVRKKSTIYGQVANARHQFYENFSVLSVEFTKQTVVESASEVKSDFNLIGYDFIKGYIAIPSKWKMRDSQKKEKLTMFKKGWQRSTTARSELSGHFSELFIETGKNYSDNISLSLERSKNALNSASETGVGLAALDSVRWFLKSLLWDATISPLSKLGYASVGYVTSNTVVFPIMVVANEGAVVTKIAVEIAVDNGRKTIDLVAPTFEAALAGTYAVSAFTVKSVGAVVLGSTAVVATTTVGIADSLSSLTIQTAGNMSGYGIEYIGVPIATAGVVLSGATAGVVVGTAKATAGSTLYLGGEASAVTTKTVGKIGAGSVIVAGTVLSAGVGSSLAVFELTKAVAVPTGYQLGSGVVLGYSSMSHIAAHTILAAADAAYLVLSLEGANWVVYTVKGNLGNGEDLIPGTVLNLNKMKNEGEKFSILPVSQDELKTVAHELQEDLLFEFED